ncbi:N [Belem virus]|uniref:Nucleoprotein n=1 Tax=Belem virus TaxID=2748241 RepID=A0A7D9MVZ9_9VIRU|nr:N [Belem virus] [Belem virus]QLA47089.1 N [Belem virus] [Belem virus]
MASRANMQLQVSDGFDFADDQSGDPKYIFEPRQAYQTFIHAYGGGLSNLNSVRIFLSKARQCKLQMREKRVQQINPRFGTLVLPLVNCHHPDFRQNRIPGDALTLRRVSGFIALYLLQQIENNPATKAIIEGGIVNPIARAKQLGWDIGYKLYLSFLPGAEFYLLEFEFFPLCIAMYRVKNGKLDEEFLDRIMAQRVDNMDQDGWLSKYADVIDRSEKIVANLKWKDKPAGRISKKGLEFLRSRGIAMKKYEPTVPAIQAPVQQQTLPQPQPSTSQLFYPVPLPQLQTVPSQQQILPQVPVAEVPYNFKAGQPMALPQVPLVTPQAFFPSVQPLAQQQVVPGTNTLPFLPPIGKDLERPEDNLPDVSGSEVSESSDLALLFGDFNNPTVEERMEGYVKAGYTKEQIARAEAHYKNMNQQQ